MGYIVLLVAVVLGAGLIREYLRNQRASEQADAEARSRIDELERRVQVLEKIVTDDGYDLKREFEKL